MEPDIYKWLGPRNEVDMTPQELKEAIAALPDPDVFGVHTPSYRVDGRTAGPDGLVHQVMFLVSDKVYLEDAKGNYDAEGHFVLAGLPKRKIFDSVENAKDSIREKLAEVFPGTQLASALNVRAGKRRRSTKRRHRKTRKHSLRK